MRQQTEMAFGVPIWDLYACELCGCALFKNTVKLHEEYHKNNTTKDTGPKFINKVCGVCKQEIEIPLDVDGSMILDGYDEHMESHE